MKSIKEIGISVFLFVLLSSFCVDNYQDYLTRLTDGNTKRWTVETVLLNGYIFDSASCLFNRATYDFKIDGTVVGRNNCNDQVSYVSTPGAYTINTDSLIIQDESYKIVSFSQDYLRLERTEVINVDSLFDAELDVKWELILNHK